MLDDLASLFDPDLHLPIGGKVYRVKPPPAAVGLQLQALHAVAVAIRAGKAVKASDRARLVLDDEDEVDLHRKALGAVYDELIADGVNIEYLRRAGNTAYLRWAVGQAAAEEQWRSRQGEAPRPLSSAVAVTRPAKGSTPTGEATTTPSPRRGSRTTSRPKKPRA